MAPSDGEPLSISPGSGPGGDFSVRAVFLYHNPPLNDLSGTLDDE
jgi:hypothetical protein